MEKLKFEQVYKDSRASFRYAYSEIPYQDEMPLHFHPEIELTYVYKGSGYRITGEYLEAFNEGELILSPSNRPHCWIYIPESCSSDGKRGCIFVQFLPQILEKGLSFFPEWEYASRWLLSIKQEMRITGETAVQVTNILKEMSLQDSDERLISLIRIIQLLCLSTDLNSIGMPNIGTNGITKSMQRIQTIYRYVVEHYMRSISLQEIADVVNMSPTTFCSFFKRETRKTFNSFVNEYRIDIICNSLKTFPNKEINQIAWESGFYDIPYFNRTFKKMMGMTPREWRDQK